MFFEIYRYLDNYCKGVIILSRAFSYSFDEEFITCDRNNHENKTFTVFKIEMIKSLISVCYRVRCLCRYIYTTVNTFTIFKVITTGLKY